MEIHTNQELSKAIDDLIQQNGIKKTWLADKLGISRQALDKMFNKKFFSLDDANKILSTIGYTAEIIIKNG